MVLSVIIPVYNGESYLEECVKSIIDQGMESYEIIAVDDGSIDNSLSILLSIENRVENFHVFSQKNLGAAAARNLGLKHAKGDAVMFIDCDDWLEPDSLKRILDKLEENTDMLVFSYRRVGRKEKTEWIQPDKVYVTGRDYYMDVLRSKIQGPGSQCWHIYGKSFLDVHHIRFNETYRRMQDWLFNLDCLQYVINVKTVGEIGYNWRIENAASLTYNFVSNFPDAVALWGQKNRNLMKRYELNANKEIIQEYYKTEMALFVMIFNFAMDAQKRREEKWKLYQECLEKDISYSAIKSTQRGIRANVLLKAKKDNNIFLLLVWKYMDVKYWIEKMKYIAAKYVIPANSYRRIVYNTICQKGRK